MSFKLPMLPYAMNALEPYMSRETLEYHHGKHHDTYIKNLNNLIAGTSYERTSLEAIIQNSSGKIFNNAAQVWNHSFYWKCLTPNSSRSPSGQLLEAIEKSFGSFLSFKKQFSDISVATFGSGWGWLVKNEDGSIELSSTSNAATPISENKIPLLTCDMWEHAYYIDHRNSRPAYLEAFWNIVNWEFVSNNFLEA